MISPAGYSPHPLFKKSGYKEGARVKLVSAPAHYRELIGPMADTLVFENGSGGGLDLIHMFTNSAQELEQLLPLLIQQIKKDGTIWVSWYKKSSGKATGLTENRIRDIALAAGLADVKVCAIDEDWSALKLVFRLKDR